MVLNVVDTILVIAVVALFTVAGAFGALFFKRGSAKFSFNPFEQLRNYNLLFGIFLYAAPTPVYLWALKNADLSIIFPINSLTYVWVSLLSIKFLNEHMNRFKWLGITSIIIGVVMISYSVV